jgi:hypothetical protein
MGGRDVNIRHYSIEIDKLERANTPYEIKIHNKFKLRRVIVVGWGTGTQPTKSAEAHPDS